MNLDKGAGVSKGWEEELFRLLKSYNISYLPFVPDAGHAKLLVMAENDKQTTPVVLTSEEEGVAFCCGAWLGGKRSVLLMQSSGVGNCINMMSMIANCNFPFVTLVTMRGDFGEFNSWQVPMGQATQPCLEAIGLTTHIAEHPDQLIRTVDAALYSAYSSDQRSAVLMSQKLIGRKEW